MVLRILESFYTNYFPKQYAVHIAIGLLSLYVVRTFAQGRTTSRDRDLHARVILVTGGFSPLGLTLIQSLAQRGAHIIALSSDPIDSPNVTILIELLRTTTNNELIYAEECDVSSPASVRLFCTKFLTGKEQRLDGIVFAHEHQHIGSPNVFATSSIEQDQKDRDAGSLATFLITTLLLPALLVAPVERDIRIINVVNPFYAASTGLPFTPSFSYDEGASISLKSSLFLREGHRSLRTIIFTRHLQRVLDALPSASQVPKTEEGSSAVPIVSKRLQKSNIIAVSVSPGLGRVDTVSAILNADWTSSKGKSVAGIILYFTLLPALYILTKSPFAAMQSILHALFLPTPFKVFATETSAAPAKDTNTPPAHSLVEDRRPQEVLRPGALYTECATVWLNVRLPEEMLEEDEKAREEAKKKKKAKGRGKSLDEDILDIVDDGEYGGEVGGRLVWESYEKALRVWEKENPPTEREREREKEAKAEFEARAAAEAQAPSVPPPPAPQTEGEFKDPYAL